MKTNSSVILSGFLEDPFLSKTVDKLKISTNQIIFISNDIMMRNNNPNVISWNKLLYPEIFNYNKTDHHDFVTENFSKDFSEAFQFFNRSLDRIYLNPLSQRDTEKYFLSLLNFYKKLFLDYNKTINLVLFHATPHFPQDIVLFFFAKFYKIKTLIIRKTLIEDCIVFDQDFRLGHSNIIDFKFKDFNSFSNKKIALKIVKKESSWLNYSKTYIGSNLKKNSLNEISKLFFQVKQILRNIIFNKTFWYFKISRINYLNFLIKHYISYYKQKKIYNKYFVITKLRKPYVLFNLHYQPERSTDPEADIFTNQIEILKILNLAVPKNLNIYLKEHPRQGMYFTDLRQTHFRKVDELLEFKKFSRIKLLKKNLPSRKLIKDASLVVSATGTSLWEACLEGIPSISFGMTWHSKCRSTPCVSNLYQTKKTISILLQKKKVDVYNDISEFLKNNKGCFLKSSNLHIFAKKSNLDYNILSNNLTVALNKIIHNNLKNG